MPIIIGRKQKQSWETLDYDIDFADWFEVDERTDTPAGHNVIVSPAGLVLVGSTLTGTVVKVVLQGGEDGVTYHVTVRLTTTSGLGKEADFTLRIKEV